MITLTPREIEVADFVALGLSNKEIADKLGISDHTAKFHVANLAEKLGARNRAHIVLLRARLGRELEGGEDQLGQYEGPEGTENDSNATLGL